jgi:ribosomal protein S18
MRTPLSVIAAILLFAGSGAERAIADETYRVWGSDRFQTPSGELRGEIAYRGRQSLSIQRKRRITVYHSRAEYDRVELGTRAHSIATFGSEATPDGELRDLETNDPDFVTVLNQPFNVELDRQTLHDLDAVAAPIPFHFPSPLDGTSLEGALQRENRTLSGPEIVGVLFHVAGPMHRQAGDRSPAALEGRITVDGTARYLKATGLLRDLDATITISGRVAPSEQTGVIAVYKRSLRREAPSARAIPGGSRRGTPPSEGRKRATLPPNMRSLRS